MESSDGTSLSTERSAIHLGGVLCEAPGGFGGGPGRTMRCRAASSCRRRGRAA
jgi:hypothetical protein